MPKFDFSTFLLVKRSQRNYVSFASTQGREKAWGSGFPQVFRRKSFAGLAQTGKTFSRLLPLFIGLNTRGSSREMPCARQVRFRRNKGVVL